MVLEFTKLEYRIIFFNHTNPTQQCHGGKTNEELKFLKLQFLKKWYSAIYFRNNVFLLKISKNCGIWPFWPSHYTISTNIYLYLQYFQQKVFSFSKIRRSQTDPLSLTFLSFFFHSLFYFLFSSSSPPCLSPKSSLLSIKKFNIYIFPFLVHYSQSLAPLSFSLVCVHMGLVVVMVVVVVVDFGCGLRLDFGLKLGCGLCLIWMWVWFGCV